VAHVALDAINKPALAIDRDDWNAVARDISAIFQDARTAHQVLMHLLALGFFLAYLLEPYSLQKLQFLRSQFSLRQSHLFRIRIKSLKDVYAFLDFLNLVVLGNVHDIRREPVKLCAVDFFRP